MQEDLLKALEVLKNGGVILYPTDTVWGLGCDATNEKAVARIYEIKKSIDKKSMLILLDNEGKILSYVKEMPEIAWDLIDLAEKPLTIIYPGAKNLAPNLIAPDGSIGIRISKETFNKKLIERFRKPIVSTSANISGEATPKKFDEISNKILQSVDYIVNWRQGDYSESQVSGIIKLEINGEIQIIRQ
ncbi:MAG: threonylcarbamoyl-AMP synthase [Bacteroidetes bacterium GWC2_33_15]|nr:MAG: threonylcarbamoyl-AMP synthase [Bacteroidetes bacterium GWA2_33_15]OFX52598.1 MAG: threonylcarbamoyl-AMP synthase [Bacteroidetes bacterium GWC2_33_15]OFX63943.1 MAG: threonylcarbamoyl-AMP synthase [Bacteroidetes bacterium GWB2_32_14]OFX70790.1 MAG: threonylcarbamoyl-AMP synthase [Bacteroidetes bacterium GWD2_33_33]HAN19918.1 threonylcarbamoyl-AMP synthase [Bacteroidales bacterium]